MYVGDRRSIRQAILFGIASFSLLVRNFDIIDADHMPYMQLIPLRLVAWIRRVPLIVTWHEWWGAEYWVAYLGRAGRLAALLERLAARSADHLIVVSPDTAASLQKDGIPADRITVIPLGVDLASIQEAAPFPRAFDLAYIGRLLAHKGVDMLLRAVASLRDAGVKVTCAIAGQGPESGALRALTSQLSLDAQVTFLEHLEEHQEVFGLMKSARVFVYPSVREGFGLAVVEALACGTPVVTCDHPDNYARHLVEDGRSGRVCQPDPASLAAAIRDVLEADLAREPLITAASQWDWAPRTEEIVALYRAAARGSL